MDDIFWKNHFWFIYLFFLVKRYYITNTLICFNIIKIPIVLCFMVRDYLIMLILFSDSYCLQLFWVGLFLPFWRHHPSSQIILKTKNIWHEQTPNRTSFLRRNGSSSHIRVRHVENTSLICGTHTNQYH